MIRIKSIKTERIIRIIADQKLPKKIDPSTDHRLQELQSVIRDLQSAIRSVPAPVIMLLSI